MPTANVVMGPLGEVWAYSLAAIEMQVCCGVPGSVGRPSVISTSTFFPLGRSGALGTKPSSTAYIPCSTSTVGVELAGDVASMREWNAWAWVASTKRMGTLGDARV